MIILGVDPGLTGAFVLLDGATIIDTLDMPTKPYGKKKQVDSARVAEWLRDKPIDHAFLEQVNAFKGGVASMFNFGRAFGMAEAVIESMGIPVQLVTPQKWKKYHNLIGSEKDAARLWAQTLFPESRHFDAIIKGQAKADAALIAVYGRHYVTQNM